MNYTTSSMNTCPVRVSPCWLSNVSLNFRKRLVYLYRNSKSPERKILDICKSKLRPSCGSRRTWSTSPSNVCRTTSNTSLGSMPTSNSRWVHLRTKRNWSISFSASSSNIICHHEEFSFTDQNRVSFSRRSTKQIDSAIRFLRMKLICYRHSAGIITSEENNE